MVVAGKEVVEDEEELEWISRNIKDSPTLKLVQSVKEGEEYELVWGKGGINRINIEKKDVV